MKVFIFGAGGSLGSQENNPHIADNLRAPLIDDIFNQKYLSYAGSILSPIEFNDCANEMQGREDKSVEKWLTEKWEAIKNLGFQHPEKVLFGQIVFYIWNLLRMISTTHTETSGYNLFLKRLKLEDEPFGLISFNYDTLLDKALSDVFKINLTSIENYSNNGVVPYLKPHGSINWIMNKRGDDSPISGSQQRDIQLRINLATRQFFNNSHSAKNSIIYDPSFGVLNLIDLQTVWNYLSNDYFYPLIFLPLTSKQYNLVGDFQETVIAEAKILLSKTNEIYLIGYRAEDEIIKELFKEIPQGVKLNVIGRGSSESIMKSVLGWSTNLKRGEVHPEGFKDFVSKLITLPIIKKAKE